MKRKVIGFGSGGKRKKFPVVTRAAAARAAAARGATGNFDVVKFIMF